MKWPWSRIHNRERELNEEIEADFALEIQQRIEAGATRGEAEFAARRDFGNVTRVKEVTREMWGWRHLEWFWQNARFALRTIFKHRGFFLTAVLTLALGIDATTAIFSVVDGVLLKPLPYPHPEKLVAVRLNFPGIQQSNWRLCLADYFTFREHNRTFQGIGIYTVGDSVSITGLGRPERVSALDVTADLLPILGVKPLLGRLFTPVDDSPGSAETAILTYDYWQSKFGGDRSVIGRTIDVDGKPRTIIGVLPQDFHFLDKTNLAILLPIELNRAKTYLGFYMYGGIARLKPGVTLAEANADVARMIPAELRSFPPLPGFSIKQFESWRIGPNLRPLKQQVVGNVGNFLWVLMGGIGLVLLIACANVANFLLVRAEGRRQELTIRAALGASRGRIAAELFSENLILAVLGGLLGLGLAYAVLRVLVAMAPTSLPRLNEIGIDGTVVLFTFAVSVAASLLFGSFPVFKYAGAGIGNRLREGGRSISESRQRHRSRGVLVIVQVALTLVLLVSSGLMIRTFRALTRVNPGFVAPSEVQIIRVSIPDTQVKDPVRVVHMEQQISQNIEAIPGVSSVGFSDDVPMDGNDSFDPVYLKDRDYSAGKPPDFRYQFVAPGFFKTLGTPLVAGRDFTWSDIYNKRPVAMVSEKLAREYWHNPSSALGKQIRKHDLPRWREIVGVVGDIHQDGVDKESLASVYWPTFLATNVDVSVCRNVAFVIRSRRAGSKSFVNEIRQAVSSVDPNLPLFEVRTLNYYYTSSMARTSFTLVMLAIGGGVGLLLGIVGLYGVIAYSVSQRRHEIGIRMALGARPEDVRKMVVRGGLVLAAVGVAVGILAALGATRFLSSLLYGVKPSDPATFIAVSLLLLAVALLASYIPARQAAKIDPMVTLRHE